ncbi:zonular occludens toxin domain-containing protein, partial [Raoultella ornithinolytica]|uniref:zonular occludens toxin domain-containing protein n=1 Tax=Raoultella ornithinolytica TaxID=54291 RepID=UPI0023510394
DRNRSHWSTSKTPSYTKSVSWQHHLLVLVDNATCVNENFLPSMENMDTFCKAGDLVIIDEVWRVWGSDKDIPKNHRSFIAEHGHFVHPETGVMSDLVVINQTVSDIPRFLKARIETTFRMQRLVALGLNKRYRVDVFQGVKLTKSNRTNYYQERYRKEIFELYQSVQGSNPVESKTDKRQSIFSSKLILFSIFLIPVLIGVSGYYVYSFFNPSVKSTKNESTTANSNNALKMDKAVFIPSKPKLNISDNWRITGELSKNGSSYVILADRKGQLRLEPRSLFQFKDRMLQGEIDGVIVNYYSGGAQ